MTRKDYVALAEAFRHTLPVMSEFASQQERDTALSQWRNDVRAVAVVLGHDNPRFRHSQFLAAAGVEV